MSTPSQPGTRNAPRALPQPSLTTILTPKWRSALNRLRQERSAGSGKFFLLALLAALCLNLRAEIVLWTTGIDAPWSIAAAIVIGGCGVATLIGVFQAMVEARR